MQESHDDVMMDISKCANKDVRRVPQNKLAESRPLVRQMVRPKPLGGGVSYPPIRKKSKRFEAGGRALFQITSFGWFPG